MQDVYIFNVQNDTDVSPHAVVNVSFSAKRADGHYLSTQQLQEQVCLQNPLLHNVLSNSGGAMAWFIIFLQTYCYGSHATSVVVKSLTLKFYYHQSVLIAT